MSGRGRCHLLRGAPRLMLAAALMSSCTSAPRTHWLPYDAPAQRPRDPWVLRCVLDKHPRMLVVALDKDLWAAYDTQTCTLYKTWRGDVNFDGPVYTTVHGPQPTTRGDDLDVPTPGTAWSAQLSGDCPFDPEHVAVSFRGHRVVDGHVQLLYALTGPDRSVVNITETIEAGHPNAGGVEFIRQFDFDPFPHGWRPLLVGPAVHSDPHGLSAPEWSESTVRMEGMHGMVSTSIACGPDGKQIESSVLMFESPTATARVRYDIDLHSPPRGTSGAARSDGEPHR